MQKTRAETVHPRAVSGFAGPGRVAIVEYLRGLAALSVTWFHLTNTYSDGWVKASGSLGWLGVEVFFVISGFVIPLSISRASSDYSWRDFPVFMMRRLVRLEPPYLVSIALVVVLWHLSAIAPEFQGQHPDYTALQLAAHLFYLIPMTGFDWLQPVYWSLAWEFAFYITMGLVFALVNPSRSSGGWYALAVLMLFLVATGLIPERALLFVIGISLFRITVRDRDSFPSGDVTVGALSAALIATFDLKIALVGACTALLIYVFREHRMPGAFGTAMVRLGAISYSLYLTHVPIGGRVVNLGKRFVDGQVFEFALSAIALTLCVAFAAAFWRFIERPCVNLGRTLAKKSGY